MDQYIKEALDLSKQVETAKEEEARYKSEQEAKFQRLKPEVEGLVGELAAMREKLTKSMECWKAQANMDKFNEFQTLVTEFDDLVGGQVADLTSALDNKLPDDMEYIMEDLNILLEEFRPKVDDALAEPCETAEEPPAEEPPVEEPPVEPGVPVEEPGVAPVEPLVEPVAPGGEPVESLYGEPEPAEPEAEVPVVEPEPEAPPIEPEAPPIEPEGP